MMKRYVIPIIMIAAAVFLLSTYAGAEATPKYKKMMKDRNVNFFEVKKEARKYFKDRDKGRGSGWKQYMRWEHFMEQRLYPSGKRTGLADPWQEVGEFRENQEAADAANWVELGPNTSQNNTGGWNPGIGRINAIVMDPNNSNTLYIGTPNGGMWRSLDAGSSWTPLTDNIPAIGVSCILIDPTDSNTIYIGTGDRDAYDCWSRGVMKSTDGGNTWNTTGLTFVPTDWQQIHVMLMHPSNPSVIWAGTRLGMYKTTDAGVTWNMIQSGDFDDMEFKPGDPSIMYATTNDDPSPICYRSTDGGNTFTATSMTSTRRAQIAVTPANPEYVYYFSKDKGIYRSTNSGVSWARMGRAPTAGSQDWYDLAIAVSPVNAEEVHIGEIESFVSFNGGKRFTKTAIWSYPNNTGYVHADIHVMVYLNGTLYVGSDGLITKSYDSGSSWINLTEGLAVRQFYRMASGNASNPYKLMGGSQDNGTSVYTTNYWHEWLGADGMECVVDYSNENILYSTIQYGEFYKSTDGGNNRVNIGQPGGGDWVTPFVIDPVDPNTLYVGNSYVKKTTNGMSTWSTIGNFGSGNINALAVAKSNSNYLYAAKDGLVWRTKNGGGAWTEISAGLPGYHVTYISVHPSDPEKVAVTLSSFYTYADGEKIFISSNAGDTWTNYSGSLPNLPANAVVYHGGASDAMYIGMDVGIYYRDNTLSDWVSFYNGLPNVVIYELEIDDSIQKIRACTYGRGLWESDLYQSTSSNPPEAGFTVDATAIYTGQTVQFTDTSTNGPNSWSWTFTGGTPASSNQQHPQVTYNTAGTYTVQLTATNGHGSDTLTRTNYITVTDAPQLPAYCTASGTTSSTEWISGVTVGSLSNSSGAAGYSDFTHLTAQLGHGSNVSVTLTPGKAVGKPQVEYWKIWIDYNGDGDFDDAGEEVFSGSAKNNAPVTGSFTVPASTAASYTGMRAAMKRGSYPTPCETFAYGEVEDYAVQFPAAESTANAAALKNPARALRISMNAPADRLTITHPNTGKAGSVQIKIYNAGSKLVRHVMHNGGHTKHVDVSDLAPGTYTVNIYNGKTVTKQTLVKQ